MGKYDNYHNIDTHPVECIFVHLDKPDTGRTDNDGNPISDNKYKVTMILDPGDAADAEVIAQVHLIAEEHYNLLSPADKKKMEKHDPIKLERDPETGDETGRYLLTAKTGRAPAVFDSKGRRIKPTPEVPWFSKLRLKLTAAPFKMPATKRAGATIYLNSAQIIEMGSGNEFEPYDGEGYEWTPEPVATNGNGEQQKSLDDFVNADGTFKADDELPF